jgi:hypothetical protein
MTDWFSTRMIAGYARLDDPDPRHLAHLAALREAGLEAKRERGHTSSLARLAGLAERLGRGARTHTAAGPTAQCCAP